MSFFSKFRRALGFDDDSIFEADEAASEADAAIVVDDPDRETLSAAERDLADLREGIFTHVLSVFNSALPDFLARSSDPEAQRRLLYDSLDQGLKDYLARVAADADSRCEARWNAEHSELRAEMEALRHKAEQVERDRADIKERQLSADRQKRALSDRLKDLESQVSRLEAEREQYDLENKSLVNKLKVYAVQHPGDIEVADVPVGPTQEQYDEVLAENGRLKEAIDLASERQAMSDEMVADLRKRLAVARQEVDDLQAITEEVAKVQQAIADRDAAIERQRANIARLKVQIDTLNAASRSEAERFAGREKELLAQLEEARSAAAERPMSYGEEVETAPAVAAPAPAPSRRTRKRRVKEEVVEQVAPKITDADLMDVEAGFADHDWFGAPEPDELSVQPTEPANDDFGYHAPEPKPRPYDDGMQMSLFD
ncbi:MAG: hypothetical protein K2F97_08125 [Muribaculaceae bacterium]|nr:hypothetical protein [Muribaculaceae bacterium]